MTLGPRIVLPVLEEVFRGDVGLVAEADEVADSDAVVARLVEQGDPQRARLGSHRHVARRRPVRGEGRVKRDFGIGVEDAETVRADDPKRRGPCMPEQLPLRRPAPPAPTRRIRR